MFSDFFCGIGLDIAATFIRSLSSCSTLSVVIKENLTNGRTDLQKEERKHPKDNKNVAI